MRKLVGAILTSIILAASAAVAVACPMAGHSEQQTVMTETPTQTPMPDKSKSGG